MLERLYVEAKLAELEREIQAARPLWAHGPALTEALRTAPKGEGVITRLFSRRRAVVAAPAEPQVAQAA
jgi:hypothetical protein